eukprot:3798071-Amphidinium_carterae.1
MQQPQQLAASAPSVIQHMRRMGTESLLSMVKFNPRLSPAVTHLWSEHTSSGQSMCALQPRHVNHTLFVVLHTYCRNGCKT